MPKIRVLVVDDAVVVRKVITETLAPRPGFGSGGHRRQRKNRAAKNPPGQSRYSHPGHRDAGNGRPGHLARGAEAVPETAGHHVQHAQPKGGRWRPWRLYLWGPTIM